MSHRIENYKRPILTKRQYRKIAYYFYFKYVDQHNLTWKQKELYAHCDYARFLFS